MGGYSYDRDVYSSSSSSSWSSSSNFGASSYSTSKLSSTTLDYSMEPNGKIIKSTTKSPIIIVLDVTGSNINFARVVYDKLPMFYGQIEQKGYLKDFDIAICAVGDAYTDSYPLQIVCFLINSKQQVRKILYLVHRHLLQERSFPTRNPIRFLLQNFQFVKGNY